MKDLLNAQPMMWILETSYMDNKERIKIISSRGRPPGFRLLEESKEKIRQSRLGTHHTKKTKDKISRSLIAYFKSRDSFTESIRNEYKDYPQPIDDWFVDHKELLDESESIMAEGKLTYLQQIEMCYGNEIDKFGHEASPEFLFMLKEELIKLGLLDELEELYVLAS